MMKKALCIFLAALLCLCTLTASAASSVPQSASPDSAKIELSDKAENLFDKFVNIMIDVIHRMLMVIRFPWKPKTERTVDMSKFTQVFKEDFDGDSLNTDVWTHYRQGVRKGGYWDKDQASLRDGCLVIRSEYKEDGRFGAGFYTDRIDTRRKYEQTYGYFECRCILPAAEGLWSAFWLSS